MALGGPRLDRPSAVGDEGRPRAASLWIASGVVVGLVAVGGFLLGNGGLLGTLGTPVGLAVAGAALVDREEYGHVVAGYLLFVLFGGGLTLLLLFLTFQGGNGIGLVGFALALGGIGIAWADVSALEGLKRLTVGTAIAYAVLLSGMIVFGIALALFLLGRELLALTTAGTTPVVSTAWFLLAAGYAAAGLRLAIWRLPLAQFVSRQRRPAVVDWLRTAGYVTLAAAVLAPVAAVAAAAVAAFGVLPAPVTGGPLAGALDLLAAPPVIGALAAVGTAAGIAGVAAVLVRLATRRFDTGSVRWVAAVTAGVALAFLLVTGVTMAFTFPAINTLRGALILVLSLVIAPPLLLFLTGGGLVGVAAGLVPDRAGGPALAAAGLVVAAVGFASPPVLVFACVAGSAVVWDAAWFGLGLTAELGHLPRTRRLELFHGVIVVGVGVVGVAALVALDALRGTVPATVGGTLALLVVGVGALLLLLPLRG